MGGLTHHTGFVSFSPPRNGLSQAKWPFAAAPMLGITLSVGRVLGVWWDGRRPRRSHESKELIRRDRETSVDSTCDAADALELWPPVGACAAALLGEAGANASHSAGHWPAAVGQAKRLASWPGSL